MNEAGVGKACIVQMDLTRHYGVEWVTNEDVSRIAEDHPDRFIPSPAWILHGTFAVDKLIHAVKTLKCRGLKLVPPVQHFGFFRSETPPLWEMALELDIPVWTHTAHQLSHPDSDARLGHPMLVEPVALKYPGLKMILDIVAFPGNGKPGRLVRSGIQCVPGYLGVCRIVQSPALGCYSKLERREKCCSARIIPCAVSRRL